MTSSPTVKLSIRRAFLRCALVCVLLWLALPALAAPVPVNGAILPADSSHQFGLRRQVGVPSIVFAKKDRGSGGGSSGNSEKGDNEEDKKEKKDKANDKEGKSNNSRTRKPDKEQEKRTRW